MNLFRSIPDPRHLPIRVRLAALTAKLLTAKLLTAKTLTAKTLTAKTLTATSLAAKKTHPESNTKIVY